ncbi:MAG TPA: peptidase M13, partial [Lactobacillus sp.]|nr:peptidase M13 [Lactobacillus sp.]
MGENTTVNEALLKDDLYQAVNGEWLKTAVIPADKATTGGFADLADNIEETLMADFGKMLTKKDRPQTKEMAEFVKFYRLASDFETRNKAGATPAKKYLDKVLALKDLKAWQDALPDLILENYDAPFELYVSPDMKDT